MWTNSALVEPSSECVYFFFLAKEITSREDYFLILSIHKHDYSRGLDSNTHTHTHTKQYLNVAFIELSQATDRDLNTKKWILRLNCTLTLQLKFILLQSYWSPTGLPIRFYINKGRSQAELLLASFLFNFYINDFVLAIEAQPFHTSHHFT